MGGYIGSRSVVLSTTAANVQDVTATDTTPEVTIVNTTHEDTDGGREGKVIFKGQQSGGEESTLAEIQGSHDGTADDEKGDLIFKTNDGSDGASPTEAMRITSAQKIGIGTNDPLGQLTIAKESGGNAPTSVAAANSYLQLGSDDFGPSSNGKFMIGFGYTDATNTNSPAYIGFEETSNSGDTKGDLTFYTRNVVTDTAPTERMRIDSSGNVLVAKTASDGAVAGHELRNGSFGISTRSGGTAFIARRITNEGTILSLENANGNIGEIGSNTNDMYVGKGDTTLAFADSPDVILPSGTSGTTRDNLIKLGNSSNRFSQLFAGTSTIGTSDENEKQQIVSLTDAEIAAAKAISKLFKTFKWNDAVTEKGDNARIHTGVVAQQIKTAMTDNGLDATKYAFYCSDTWWEAEYEVAEEPEELDGEGNVVRETRAAFTSTKHYYSEDDAPEGATQKTRLGVRYEQLLAFVGAATEQRLTSIEARLTALEAE